MPRLTKIYTRTGDEGDTRLGTGERVPKTSARIVAYGTIDELNAQLGVVLATAPARELTDPLRQIQNELFHLGAELCVPPAAREKTSGPSTGPHHVAELEKLIDRLSKTLEPLKSFVLPGGTLAAAHLQLARTVCRRAEREAVRLSQKEPIGAHVIPYLNRLSDALFVMARYENKLAGIDETLWNTRA